MKQRRELALRSQEPTRFSRLSNDFMLLAFILFLAFTIYLGLKIGFSDPFMFFLYTVDMLGLVAYLFERLQFSTPPKTKKRDEIEQWIWKRNLKLNIYYVLLAIGLMFIYSFLFRSPIVKFIQTIDLIFLAIAALCLLSIFINPRLFLNPFINSLGTSGILLFAILYLLHPVFTHQYYWAFLVATIVVPLIIWWWKSRNETLSLFQLIVLYGMDIERLFHALRTSREVLLDKSHAINTWLRLEKRFSLSEKDEFIRLLASVESEKRKPYQAILNISSWIFLAIVGAIIALLAEDFLYAPLIKSYFCQIRFLQSWLSCSK